MDNFSGHLFEDGVKNENTFWDFATLSQGQKPKALGNNADNFWNFQSILRPGKQDVKLTFQPN